MKDKTPTRINNPVRRHDTSRRQTEVKERNILLGKIRCVARAAFWLNVVFFVMCIICCAGGIFLISDKIIMLYMIDDSMLNVSCWLLITSSGIMICTAVLGGLAAILLNRHLLSVYVCMVTLITLTLLFGGIMALNMQVQFGDWAVTRMSETLKQYYGVDEDNEYNLHVTRAWDIGQTSLACCGVSGAHSWVIYRSSRWYRDRPGFENIMHQNDATVKLFVPQSCCVRDDKGRYVNITMCQQFEDGPPALREGEFNEGLHYKDCFSAMTEWMYKYSSWLAGLGLSVGLSLVSGMVMAVYISLKLPNHPQF